MEKLISPFTGEFIEIGIRSKRKVLIEKNHNICWSDNPIDYIRHILYGNKKLSDIISAIDERNQY